MRRCKCNPMSTGGSCKLQRRPQLSEPMLCSHGFDWPCTSVEHAVHLPHAGLAAAPSATSRKQRGVGSLGGAPTPGTEKDTTTLVSKCDNPVGGVDVRSPHPQLPKGEDAANSVPPAERRWWCTQLNSCWGRLCGWQLVLHCGRLWIRTRMFFHFWWELQLLIWRVL